MDGPDVPICYHVYATEAGWEVAFDHQQPLRLFANEESAIAAARSAAEARWLLTRRPTCVGRGRPDQDTVIDCAYA